MTRLRAAYSPHYTFDLGPGHPFPMSKYRRVHDALLADGTLAADRVLAAAPATDEELAAAHSRDYVDRFLQGELSAQEQRRLGFPWSVELCRRSLFATGGTLLATQVALEDGMAANLAGGSHHAFTGHGEGYCAFNDLAVAVRCLRRHSGRRVAIIDCDVHQGNGTAGILAEEPGVFTFSIHCETNYPARKVPGSRDLGLAAGTGDEEYVARLAAELDDIWDRFRPELVFFQSGVDPLAGDRLGRLRLTREGLRQRDRMVLGRCLETQVPAVVVLGGGYAAETDETVSAHADTIRTAARLLSGKND